jgi:DNA polymerase III delta prime subunit
MTQPNDTYELPEDLFGREAIAEKIKGLLESDIDLSPMVIDGDWGIGKTVFCHRLINKIKASNKLNCVYIDAFRADHVDDPLITIISEIGKMVVKKQGQQKLDSFISNAKPFLRTATKTLGKAAVSIALKQSTDDIAEGYDKEVEALAGASIDASIDLVIRDKINAEKNLDTLHDALKEVTKEKELIILIDELDRCRATFAIDMLETIKHAFSIPKVKIVIVTNSSHLETSFRHRYGSNNGTKSYLEKFYKFKYSLPSVKTEFGYKISNTTSHSLNYLRKLMAESKYLPSSFYFSELFKIGMRNLINSKNISLREVELISRYIDIVSNFDDGLFNNDMKSFYSVIAIYLHIKNSDISFESIKVEHKMIIPKLLGVTDTESVNNCGSDPIAAISCILIDDTENLLSSISLFGLREIEDKKYIFNHFNDVLRVLRLE